VKKFGFIVHPVSIRNIHHFFPPSKLTPESWVKKALKCSPCFKLEQTKVLRSKTGAQIQGYFFVCPLLSSQILELDEEFVVKKVLSASKLAEKMKVDILGLGALAGTVGEGAKKIADAIQVPITNGTTYAACAVIETVLKAAQLRNINLKNSKVAIIGATNAIGKLCAYVLSKQVGRLAVVAKKQERILDLIEKLKSHAQIEVENCATDVAKALDGADIVIFTTTAVEVAPKIKIEHLKKGAIICDIPVPRNITPEIFKDRPDLLVIDGAAILPPFEIKLKMDTGLSKNQIYACMAETMILAFEGKFEDFSFGFEPSLEKLDEICRLAKKHGFSPAFTSFGKKIE
jgi:fatty aldehyde-generating acyl-ACP reductase